jgi:hypothetical protein
MSYDNHLSGDSPDFDDDDIDWAMGELLHMISLANRAGMSPQRFNPLLFHRAMRVIGRQPHAVRSELMATILANIRSDVGVRLQ